MSELERIAKAVKNDANPPVHRWKPDFCGDIDIRIDAQGIWFHQGTPIGREALVALFASVLWYEGGDYYLVTPVEKMRIQVEDVPFIVIASDLVENDWQVTAKPPIAVTISRQHPVELRRFQGDWVPYIRLRYELWARVNRNVYYQWIDAALEQGIECDQHGILSLTSEGYHFPIARL